MQKGAIFIQPHSDDTVMSSYFLIKTEILPRPYYLLTVFGQSNWIDPIKRRGYRYTQNKNQTAITHLRKNEDRRFAKSLGFTLVFYNLKDCLLRNKEVFFQPNKKLDADLVTRVNKIINASIRKYKAQNMIAPFPFGVKQHYDHRVVREAVRSLPATLCNLFFVDDIPYSRIRNQKKNGLSLFARLRVVDADGKVRAMKMYNSQMCELFLSQAQKIAKQNHGYERVFTLIKK